MPSLQPRKTHSIKFGFAFRTHGLTLNENMRPERPIQQLSQPGCRCCELLRTKLSTGPPGGPTKVGIQEKSVRQATSKGRLEVARNFTSYLGACGYDSPTLRQMQPTAFKRSPLPYKTAAHPRRFFPGPRVRADQVHRQPLYQQTIPQTKNFEAHDLDLGLGSFRDGKKRSVTRKFRHFDVLPLAHEFGA